MKRIFVLIVVVAALWAAAWAAGALALQTAATRGLQGLEAEGWQARAERISVSGFPVRFVTVFEDYGIADPSSGVAGFAPVGQVTQDIWRLDRISAAWPEGFTITADGEEITAQAPDGGLDARMTVDLRPTARFALDGFEATSGAVQLTSNAGWQAQWQRATLDVAQAEGTQSAYDISAAASEIAPPTLLRTRLDPEGALPPTLQQITLQGRASFDAPWDMDASGPAQPQITQLVIEDLSAQWGEMLIRASGTLDVDGDGIPTGDLDVRAENWATMVDLAENAGLLPERLRPATEGMLGVLAGLNGSEAHIDTVLSFTDGRVFLGPLPIGPAPSLRLP